MSFRIKTGLVWCVTTFDLLQVENSLKRWSAIDSKRKYVLPKHFQSTSLLWNCLKLCSLGVTKKLSAALNKIEHSVFDTLRQKVTATAATTSLVLWVSRLDSSPLWRICSLVNVNICGWVTVYIQYSVYYILHKEYRLTSRYQHFITPSCRYRHHPQKSSIGYMYNFGVFINRNPVQGYLSCLLLLWLPCCSWLSWH